MLGAGIKRAGRVNRWDYLPQRHAARQADGGADERSDEAVTE